MHAEAAESPAEEAVSDCQGEDTPSGGAQQGHPGSQQAREPMQGAPETQQDTKGTPNPTTDLCHLNYLLWLFIK